MCLTCHNTPQSTWPPLLELHNDIIKWKHFPRYWPYVWGIHRSLMNSPGQGQWCELWCFFDLCLNKRLSKQSRRQWFEMPSHSLWSHRNDKNTLRPRDTNMNKGIESSLVWLLACLTICHYLNQCRLEIIGIHSSRATENHFRPED